MQLSSITLACSTSQPPSFISRTPGRRGGYKARLLEFSPGRMDARNRYPGNPVSFQRNKSRKSESSFPSLFPRKKKFPRRTAPLPYSPLYSSSSGASISAASSLPGEPRRWIPGSKQSERSIDLSYGEQQQAIRSLTDVHSSSLFVRHRMAFLVRHEERNVPSRGRTYFR